MGLCETICTTVLKLTGVIGIFQVIAQFGLNAATLSIPEITIKNIPADLTKSPHVDADITLGVQDPIPLVGIRIWESVFDMVTPGIPDPSGAIVSGSIATLEAPELKVQTGANDFIFKTVLTVDPELFISWAFPLILGEVGYTTADLTLDGKPTLTLLGLIDVNVNLEKNLRCTLTDIGEAEGGALPPVSLKCDARPSESPDAEPSLTASLTV